MNNDIFICSKCGAKFERNKHYDAVLKLQNNISMIFGNKKVIDMCGKCNYFEYEK